MTDIRLGPVESRFADLIWENEPLASGELVQICQEELNWKKSTTYTVLRRLIDRGIFKNEKGMVTSLISKSEFNAVQSEKFVEETFAGSLPQFLTAFTKRKKLSDQEIAEIQKIIEERRG
ncbi:MAG: BlaI/MecI/CopY family transcriptional regulator [Firmicutes bacterium]|jgi:predicted transcriptional regulator|nr:BlaI/MecI/CopY family transcriptional regulator [Bacillota bacterium]